MTLIKRIITLLFIAIFLIIGGISLNNYLSYQVSTPEHDYEKIFNKKISTLLDIVVGPYSYYVETTVFLRHEEERSFNSLQTPKSILYEKETIQNKSQTSKNETPFIETKKTKANLPGMASVLNKTKRYELSNKIKTQKLSLNETNNSHKEVIEEIYYDENKTEIIKPNHGLERIQILMMINTKKLAEKRLTITDIENRIYQIIPFKESRGDTLTIESKLFDFTPPYLKIVQEFYRTTNFEKNLIICLIFCGIALICLGLFKLTVWFINYRQQQKLNAQKLALKKHALLKEEQDRNKEIQLNKKVIKTIENDVNQTQEIVEYWMEQHYANK